MSVAAWVARAARGVFRLLVFLALGVAAQPSVADIYRWVDDQGVTHFSQALPPHMAGQASVERGSEDGGSSVVERLRSGDWFALIGNHMYRLEFWPSDFFLGCGPIMHRFTAGRWSYGAGQLRLRFESRQPDARESPECELASVSGKEYSFTVHDAPGSALWLNGPEVLAGKWILVKSRELNGPIEEQLVGYWAIQKNDAFIRLSLDDDGTFEYEESYHERTTRYHTDVIKEVSWESMGTWEYNAPFLELHRIQTVRVVSYGDEDYGDGRLAVDRSMRKVRWRVERIGPRHMRLLNRKRGVRVYTR